jgi:hypothetical protein
MATVALTGDGDDPRLHEMSSFFHHDFKILELLDKIGTADVVIN